MNGIKKTGEIGRGLSFALIGAIYIVATVVGIVVYAFLPTTLIFPIRLLVADVAATVATFIFSLIFKNASVYDPYWSVQPIVILLALAVTHGVTTYTLVLLLAVLFWGVRLTANWAYTFKGMAHEDWRYRMLKEKTGVFYPVINFVGIHMVPTLVVYGCTLPAAMAIIVGADGEIFSYFALLLSLCAAVMQGIADIQMHRFRKRGEGGFIREGLWKNSRHPNYLGEILMWWGIGISAVTALDGGRYFLLAGAVANTLLFLFVSIPLADGRQSRKSGFETYKKQTRMLLPFPKNNK